MEVLTSYLAANATILPISGWLSAHLGRRNYFLLSIAVFTVASGMCGMATSLEQLILFRVIQGLAGGGLQPSSQGVLLDSFPPEKQGAAQTMFGIAALLAPVVGPTLGGYLTVNYNWRWIFYINIPVGALGFLASYLVVKDPEYLTNERAELRRQPLNFDYASVWGCSFWSCVLLGNHHAQQGSAVGLVQLDPVCRVQVLFVFSFTVGLWLPDLPRSLRIAHPVVDFRPLAGAATSPDLACIIFCACSRHVPLWASGTSLPKGCCNPSSSADRLCLGIGPVALGRFLDPDAGHHRDRARAGHRRPLVDRRHGLLRPWPPTTTGWR